MSDDADREAIRVNGRCHAAETGLTVERLLERLEIRSRYALVERNGVPVSQDRFGVTELEPGDELVIARPVAGG